MTHTTTGQSGCGDCGKKGINSFIKEHTCGVVCEAMSLSELIVEEDDLTSIDSPRRIDLQLTVSAYLTRNKQVIINGVSQPGCNVSASTRIEHEKRAAKVFQAAVKPQSQSPLKPSPIEKVTDTSSIVNLCCTLVIWLNLKAGVSRETANIILKAIHFILSTIFNFLQVALALNGIHIKLPEIQIPHDLHTAYHIHSNGQLRITWKAHFFGHLAAFGQEMHDLQDSPAWKDLQDFLQTGLILTQTKLQYEAPGKTGVEVLQQAQAWLNMTTKADAKRQATATGVRWTSLHRLPYRDPVWHTILGFMHNWLEESGDELEQLRNEAIEAATGTLDLPPSSPSASTENESSTPTPRATPAPLMDISMYSDDEIGETEDPDYVPNYTQASFDFAKEELKEFRIAFTYRASIQELLLILPQLPNHHYAMHNEFLLKYWGPLAGLSEFPGERINGMLQKIKTNRHLYDMDYTMLKTNAPDFAAFLHSYMIINQEYLQSTGRPHWGYLDLPHPEFALILPPNAKSLAEFHDSGRTYSCNISHTGNSAIQFYGKSTQACLTGVIDTILEIPLEDFLRKFILVHTHLELDSSDAMCTPNPQYPRMMTKAVKTVLSDDTVVIEPQHIITHLKTYKRPAGTYGIQQQILVQFNSVLFQEVMNHELHQFTKNQIKVMVQLREGKKKTLQEASKSAEHDRQFGEILAGDSGIGQCSKNTKGYT
ncbi:hypothetical protein BT96DRAFT_946277 [Gymnopus androsaceus JB14]|uniref:Alpha-type protein kinase domain-containing protein n=1 Tax=Gymnopus androsaceus JB14 TaxID=1447944 RepID=A0A6A4GWU0_9AGAR|nr:hypothetical protein BT96DRAFT_946277 [Gymnopus androsaceus JB14]